MHQNLCFITIICAPFIYYFVHADKKNNKNIEGEKEKPDRNEEYDKI